MILVKRRYKGPEEWLNFGWIGTYKYFHARFFLFLQRKLNDFPLLSPFFFPSLLLLLSFLLYMISTLTSVLNDQRLEFGGV